MSKIVALCDAGLLRTFRDALRRAQFNGLQAFYNPHLEMRLSGAQDELGNKPVCTLINLRANMARGIAPYTDSRLAKLSLATLSDAPASRAAPDPCLPPIPPLGKIRNLGPQTSDKRARPQNLER